MGDKLKNKIIETYGETGIYLGNNKLNPIGIIYDFAIGGGSKIPNRYFLHPGDELPVKNDKEIVERNLKLGAVVLGMKNNKKSVKDILLESPIFKKILPDYKPEDLEELKKIKEKRKLKKIKKEEKQEEIKKEDE